MRSLFSKLFSVAALVLVLGCESTAPTVPFETPVLKAKEGMTFGYLVDYRIDGKLLEFYGECRLISTIAEIGGRDSLLAYEWAPENRLEFWDTRNGELWQFHSTEDITGDPQTGVWMQFPTSGTHTITTLLADTTFEFFGGSIRIQRLFEAVPGKRESIRDDGRVLELQHVSAKLEELQWQDGILVDSLTTDYKFALIEGLGMVESSTEARGINHRKLTLLSIEED